MNTKVIQIKQTISTLINEEHYLKIYKNRYGKQLRYHYNNIISNLKTGGFYHCEDLIYKECGLLQSILRFYINDYKEIDNELDSIINKLKNDYKITVLRTVTIDGFYYKFLGV